MSGSNYCYVVTLLGEPIAGGTKKYNIKHWLQHYCGDEYREYFRSRDDRFRIWRIRAYDLVVDITDDQEFREIVENEGN